VARPRCLYCGAAIEAVLPARVPAASAPHPAEAARSVVLVDVSGASPAVAAEALELMAFEAEQCARRGGWQVHRLGRAEAMEIEAERVRQTGLNALVVSAAELAPAETPLVVIGGRGLEGGLRLRAEGKTLDLRSEDILLLVVGTIHREVTDEVKKRHSRPPRPQPGLRFHFHRHADPRPFELDPDSFAFDDAPGVPSSSLMEIRSWITALAPAPITDTGFRDLTPALSPAEPTAPALVTALRAGPAREDAATILDNLGQFRFYSGWRAALARRHARS
jgi:hypothetical protein